MSARSKQTQGERRAARQLEQSRIALAEERNRAIESVNGIKGQMNQLMKQHEAMRNDMVRWVTAFMLKTGQHEMSFQSEFLKKTDAWVLQRDNNKDADSITWRLVDRAEYVANLKTEKEQEAEQLAAITAQLAKQEAEKNES
tara:strand:+ start:49673 stop:50098 length:426 start_codon:yes stop_codon:yes gene_type:complete